MDTRQESRFEFIGGLIGCAVGVATAFLLVWSAAHHGSQVPGDAEEGAGLLAVFVFPTGLFLGTFFGAVLGRRYSYRRGNKVTHKP